MNISRVRHLHHKHFYVLSVLLFFGVVSTYAYVLYDIQPEAPVSSSAAANAENAPFLGVKVPINSEEAARKLAGAQKPDADIVRVQTVRKSSGISYQVLFNDGSSVEVLAKDGTVINPDKPLESEPAKPPTDETPAEETPAEEEQPAEETPTEEPESPSDSSMDSSAAPSSDV